MDYVFYKAADTAQDEIWDYTVENWGEAQAEKYIIGLHGHIRALAGQEKLWRLLPGTLILPGDLDADIYFSRYERHLIFFRVLSSGVLGVLSIIHESRDIPVTLAKDLRGIEGKNP